jgi:hypothetical protein
MGEGSAEVDMGKSPLEVRQYVGEIRTWKSAALTSLPRRHESFYHGT